jgi:hypothetical protein
MGSGETGRCSRFRREEMIMGTTTRLAAPEDIEYPESDGEPIAENTEQYDWIVLIKEGLEGVFRDDPNVFIAADVFWYPVERNNKIRRAPDVLVASAAPRDAAARISSGARAGSRPRARATRSANPTRLSVPRSRQR